MTVEVNYLAVLVGAIISMVMGFLWYGPVFGKIWMAEMKFPPEAIAEAKNKGMAKSYILMSIGSIVMACVLWHSIVYASGFMQQSGAWVGVQAGFWSWLGFVAPVMLGTVIWEGRSWRLWFVNAGYYLASLVVVGAVLASWMV